MAVGEQPHIQDGPHSGGFHFCAHCCLYSDNLHILTKGKLKSCSQSPFLMGITCFDALIHILFKYLGIKLQVKTGSTCHFVNQYQESAPV